MRLIIDVPEKVNEHIRSAVGHGYYPFFDDDEGHIVGKAISNGTPIPDNATNGDVIKAMFPFYDNEIYEHKGYIMAFYEDFYTTYPLRWWNAPYQKEGDKE